MQHIQPLFTTGDIVKTKKGDEYMRVVKYEPTLESIDSVIVVTACGNGKETIFRKIEQCLLEKIAGCPPLFYSLG